ncbi:DegV family protein [Thalassobacillus sp. CUG 92003]|uniref:DegV family protein n=1 Tax=Thalassobacillus sp. CUG 92003 TaxID=2736641 RepID=UPI0015E6B9FD|nr:DegV family protein [Thalassobacillus sp. CUG 92003]
MTIKIICDSACDLSHEAYHEYGLDMLPLKVTLDDKEYEDGKSISPEQVYAEMRNGKTPKTVQVTAQTFTETFTNYAEKQQPFIYFAFSSELSGTYQTAKMVEQEVKSDYPDADFHVIDTKCASLGCGLVVLRAAEMAHKGAERDDIIKEAQTMAANMEHIFTVEDLEYLYRGGRVSRTAAFVGSLLKIKPLLHVENGQLKPLEKIRGSKKVLRRMVDVMKERGNDVSEQRIAISHGDAQDKAEQLAELIQEELNPKDIYIHQIGAVIGAHAGPGTLALFFLNDTQSPK